MRGRIGLVSHETISSSVYSVLHRKTSIDIGSGIHLGELSGVFVLSCINQFSRVKSDRKKGRISAYLAAVSCPVL
jgi:hypothetical protein